MSAGFKDKIIAGRLKGRVLVLPDDEGVRPSKNRVRQAAFNMLASRVDFGGLSAVDLFCGSGAWGLEAYSRGCSARGCSKVVLVDKEVAFARKNVLGLGVEKDVVVVQRDVFEAGLEGAPFGLILADPPYGKGMVQRVLARRDEFGAAGSWWCVETERDVVLDWTGFSHVEQRGHGGSWVWVGRQG